MPTQEGHTVAVDPQDFRTALGHYPTGVAVITAEEEDGSIVAMVVGSFTSVSLDPPLVSFLPTRGSSRFARIRAAGRFCVNVLSAHQEQVCRTVGRQGSEGLGGIAWSRSASGLPVIDGAVAAIECDLDSVSDAGDHYIVLGAVTSLRVLDPVPPLLFFQGGYGAFIPSAANQRHDLALIEAGRVAERARAVMAELAAAVSGECDLLVPAGENLVVAATVAAEGVSTRARVAGRVPLVPPLGEAYVAFAEKPVQDAWVGNRVLADDPSLVQECRRRLEEVRARGWAVSRSGVLTDADLQDALNSYAFGTPTPASLRAVHETVRTSVGHYDPLDLDGEGELPVGTLVAPVLDGDGEPTAVVRISQMSSPASAAQIRRWADALTTACARIAALTAPTNGDRP